jgi:hypothetical protein
MPRRLMLISCSASKAAGKSASATIVAEKRRRRPERSQSIPLEG